MEYDEIVDMLARQHMEQQAAVFECMLEDCPEEAVKLPDAAAIRECAMDFAAEFCNDLKHDVLQRIENIDFEVNAKIDVSVKLKFK